MEEFIFRLTLGILGAIAAVVVSKLWEMWQYKKGDLTGIWEENIYDSSNNILKKDRVELKHNYFTKKVLGKVKREFPKEEDYKEWEFQGIVRGNMLFILYWSTDLSTNSGSYGTIQLNQINESKLTGFYIRPISKGKNDKVSNSMKKVVLDWSRIK